MRLCHAMIGAIASMRLSSAAVVSSIPPAYDTPVMPTRGSPAASSCASGCCASQSISAITSRASLSGASTVTVPPELPNPRLSQVSTLKPALRSAPTPTLPVVSSLAAFGSVAREPAQPWPWRIVGAFPPPGDGWNESTICVPSNDVIVASRA